MQQLGEEFLAQVIDQAQRDFGQIIITQKRADALPSNDHDQQQRNAVKQFHCANQRKIVTCLRGFAGQSIDEILEDARHHRLRRRKDNVAGDAGQKKSDKGLEVGQEAEVDAEG